MKLAVSVARHKPNLSLPQHGRAMVSIATAEHRDRSGLWPTHRALNRAKPNANDTSFDVTDADLLKWEDFVPGNIMELESVEAPVLVAA